MPNENIFALNLDIPEHPTFRFPRGAGGGEWDIGCQIMIAHKWVKIIDREYDPKTNEYIFTTAYEIE